MIKKEMQFYSFNDFFKDARIIKAEYEKLSIQEKRLYKMYVYSICFEKEYVKDMIWEYLNDFEYAYSDMCAERRKRIRKGAYYN